MCSFYLLYLFVFHNFPSFAMLLSSKELIFNEMCLAFLSCREHIAEIEMSFVCEPIQNVVFVYFNFSVFYIHFYCKQHSIQGQ